MEWLTCQQLIGNLKHVNNYSTVFHVWRLWFFSVVESPIKHSSLDNKRTSPLSFPFQQSTAASLETKPFPLSVHLPSSWWLWLHYCDFTINRNQNRYVVNGTRSGHACRVVAIINSEVSGFFITFPVTAKLKRGCRKTICFDLKRNHWDSTIRTLLFPLIKSSIIKKRTNWMIECNVKC